MAGASNSFAVALMNHFFRGDVINTSSSQPSAIYLSLHEGDPTDAGLTSKELYGANYARKIVTFSAPQTDELNVTTMVNSNSITFYNLPSAMVTHVGLWSSETGGTMLESGLITSIDATPRTQIELNNGDNLAFGIGIIKITVL